jgi:hypothetical protein
MVPLGATCLLNSFVASNGVLRRCDTLNHLIHLTMSECHRFVWRRLGERPLRLVDAETGAAAAPAPEPRSAEIILSAAGVTTSARPREGGDPALCTRPWIPACAGMSG